MQLTTSYVSLPPIFGVLTLTSRLFISNAKITTNQLEDGESINQSEQRDKLTDAAFYQSYNVTFIANVFRYLLTAFRHDYDPVVCMLFEDTAFLENINQERERWSFEELISSWFQSSMPKIDQTGQTSSKLHNASHGCLLKPPKIAKNFKRCHCLRNCSLEDSAIIASRLSRQMKAIYFATNWNSSFDNTTQLASVDPTEGVTCYVGLGCCYYFRQFNPYAKMTVLTGDIFEMRGAFVSQNCTHSCTTAHGVIVERSVSGGDIFLRDCVVQINSRRTLKANIAELCDLSRALQKHVHINGSITKDIVEGFHIDATGKTRNTEVCTQERQQTHYLLAYSQFGLLSIASFILTHHSDSCAKHYKCSPLWPDLPKHPLTLLHDEIATHTNISLALDALAIVLNIIVLALLIRSTRSNVLSSRATQFLMHICVSSALYGVLDLATGILNFYSGAMLNRTAVFADEHYLNILKTMCQFASLSLFVAFAVFQIVPLLHPFESYSLFERPNRMLVLIWIASLLVSVTVNTLPILLYLFSFRQVVRDIRALDLNITRYENFHNASILTIARENRKGAERVLEALAEAATERSLALTLSASLIDVSLSLFLLFAGEVTYMSMVVTVIYIMRSRKKVIEVKNLQQQHINSSNKRTVKSLVTMFISLSALCLSSIPSHALTIMVIMFTKYDIGTTTVRDLIGVDTIWRLVIIYMRTRVALLIEPILSPLLIMIRYDNLTLLPRANRSASLFATSQPSKSGQHKNVTPAQVLAATKRADCPS